MFDNLTDIQVTVLLDAVRGHKHASANIGHALSDTAEEYDGALRDLLERLDEEDTKRQSTV